MNSFVKFIPAVLLIVVLFLVKQSTYHSILHPQIWYIALFFIVLDFLVLRIANMGFEQDNFINFYLGATVIRMILIMIFAGFFMYFFPENRKLFIITSVVFYLFFTIFEISILLRNLRRF